MVWAQTMVGAKMFVYFKTASGKFMRLDVPSSACVADVKRLLAARNPEAVGADPACFHLVFRGHQLAEDVRDLADDRKVHGHRGREKSEEETEATEEENRPDIRCR